MTVRVTPGPAPLNEAIAAHVIRWHERTIGVRDFHSPSAPHPGAPDDYEFR